MKPLGIRDIVGPIMVGPSSSHTAGALRIASMVRNLLTDEPARVSFVYMVRLLIPIAVTVPIEHWSQGFWGSTPMIYRLRIRLILRRKKNLSFRLNLIRILKSRILIRWMF